jgi:PhnB protein
MKRKPKVHFIPHGYHEVNAYLSIRGAAQAIEFYRKAFGAKEVMRMPGPEGKLGHAEIAIGATRVMLADEHAEMLFLGPQSRGGTTVHLHVYVKDADATVARAVKAGGKLVRGLRDEFYGDRTGTIEDPFGHVWHIATHTRDVSVKEMKKVAQEWADKQRAAKQQE